MRIHADPNTDPHSTALLSPNYSLHSRTMLNSGSMANTKNTIKENDTILPSSCHRTTVEPFYLIKNSVLDRNRTILDSTEFQARCHGGGRWKMSLMAGIHKKGAGLNISWN